MGALAPTLFTAKNKRLPIETARAIAVVLLVSYHVIGSGPDAGLEVNYPSLLRLFADFFVDLRMPLFALIAGLVFAMKPPLPSGLGSFFLGKARRLMLPGIVALLAFEAAAKMGHTHFDVGNHYLQPLLTGYAHFWFLQSILLIFLIYAPLHSLTSGKIAPYALLASVLFSLSHIDIRNDPFSIDGAIMLLPYFIIGVVVWQHRDWILAHRWPLAACAAALLIAGSLWNLSILHQTGTFSEDRRDLQSLLSASGGCLLAMLLLPQVKMLDGIAAMSFTIYLYHTFGTSLMRRALDGLGVEFLAFHLILGVALGLALPIGLHMMAARFGPTRMIILGLKPLQSQKEKTGQSAKRAT